MRCIALPRCAPLSSLCCRIFVKPDEKQATLNRQGQVRKADGRVAAVWAFPSKNGRPWYDRVTFVHADGTEKIGRARAVVAALNRVIGRKFIAERVTTAETEVDHPFTAYGCKRLLWAFIDGASTVDLAAVPLADISMV